MTLVPDIAVIIATRGRPEQAAAAIRSVLACAAVAFELVVVDQSDGPETETALATMLSDDRLTYVRSSSVGASAARNLGFSRTSAPLIAVTDDDCIVDEQWLVQLSETFAAHPEIGVVFGEVLEAEHDSDNGFVPGYHPPSTIAVQNLRRWRTKGGMGACMGVRRSTWEAIGGFDPMLGPGARFGAGEDSDIAIKALRCTFGVLETPTVFVLHSGYRSWTEGRALARRNWFGMGAALAKHLKVGCWPVLRVTFHEFFGVAVHDLIFEVVRRRRVRGIVAVVSFSKGFAAGLMSPIAADKLNYLVPATLPETPAPT